MLNFIKEFFIGLKGIVKKYLQEDNLKLYLYLSAIFLSEYRYKILKTAAVDKAQITMFFFNCSTINIKWNLVKKVTDQQLILLLDFCTFYNENNFDSEIDKIDKVAQEKGTAIWEIL